jgi:hypothetical protein
MDILFRQINLHKKLSTWIVSCKEYNLQENYHLSQ